MSIRISKMNSTLTGWNDEDFTTIERDFIKSEGIADKNADGSDYEVSESSPQAMTVEVNDGVAYVVVTKNGRTWYVRVENDAVATVVVAPNVSGSTRIDALVLKVSVSTEPNASATNVASLEFVQGTPGGGAPSDGDITTALGSDGWIRIADVTVANGVGQIFTADIEDTRAGISFGLGNSPARITYYGDGSQLTGVLHNPVDTDILPETDATYDLGSAIKQFRDLFLEGDANVGGNVDAVSFSGNGSNLTGIIVDPVQRAVGSVSNIAAGDAVKIVIEGGQEVFSKIQGQKLKQQLATGVTGYEDLCKICMLTSTRAIILYNTYVNSNWYGKVFCAELQADGTWLAGSHVTIANADPNSTLSSFYSLGYPTNLVNSLERVSDTCFLLGWSSVSNINGKGSAKIIVGTVSERTITMGSNTGLTSSDGDNDFPLVSHIKNFGSGNFVCYTTQSNTNQNIIRGFSVDEVNRTITLGNSYQVATGARDDAGYILKLSATSGAVFYGSSYRKFTIDHSTKEVTFQASAVANPVSGSSIRFLESKDDNVGIVAYKNASNYPTVVRYTELAGTFTLGTALVLNSNNVTLYSSILNSAFFPYDLTSGLFAVQYNYGGTTKIAKVRLDDSGCTLINEFNDGAGRIYVDCFYYRLIAVSGGTTINAYLTCGDIQEFVGIAKDSKNIGENLSLITLGKTTTVFSGLIPSKKYYLDCRGAITPNTTSLYDNNVSFTNQYLGMALGSGEMIMKL
jgi:hypothetical protein